MDFKGVGRQCIMVFLKKNIVKRLIFCKSGTSLKLKWGKLSVKTEQNRGKTAPPKPLVAIGEL